MTLMKRVIIVGPTSWDTVINIVNFPENGGFAQGKNRSERPGGSGLNIAAAVASSGVRTRLISYVGDDNIGSGLLENLQRTAIQEIDVKVLPGPSLHAIITVDDDGERTVFALEENRFSEIESSVTFDKNDVVVFPVWRAFYRTMLESAQLVGATTVVGVNAIKDKDIHAEYIVGSIKDVTDFEFDSDRFQIAVITKGPEGVEIFYGHEKEQLPAKPVPIVDATGAGDSFLAGMLVGLAQGERARESAEIGIHWASFAIQSSSSVPPHWDEIQPLG